MNACQTCRWAEPFPEAGPPPAKPQPPKFWLWRLFWTDPASDHRQPYHWAVEAHERRVRNHARLVECRRYPERITKRKDDLCGEFA